MKPRGRSSDAITTITMAKETARIKVAQDLLSARDPGDLPPDFYPDFPNCIAIRVLSSVGGAKT